MNDAVSYQNSIPDEQSGISINFADLKLMAFRQRIIIAIIILASLVLGVIVTLVSPAVYEAEAKVLIEPDTNDVLRDEVDIRTRLRGGEVQRYLNSQLDLIQSRNMAGRVVKELKLDREDNFLINMGIDPTEFSTDGKTADQAKTDQIIDTMIENLEVDLPFGNQVATITFQSRDQALAQNIVNAYASNLISANIEQRYEASEYAREFISNEIAAAKKRLEESERKAILYARNTQIIDASDGVSSSDESRGPRSITTSNLVLMNNDLAAARTARILAEEKWLSTRDKSPLDIADVQQNPTIQNLLAVKTEKEAELRELLNRYKADHPVAKQSQLQITSIDNDINQIADGITRTIRSEYEIALSQEKSLQKSLNELKNDTLEEQNKRVELNLLAREVETNRAQYQSLLGRFEEVNTNSDIVTNNISILDNAQFAEQVAPQPLINLVLALFIGIVIAFFTAFLREAFDDTIRSPDEVANKLGLPLLGTTPLYKSEEPIFVSLADRKSAIAEAYSSIRSSLDFSTARGAPPTMMLTSSQPAEGKSTSAIAIADSFGRVGKRILLIDADIRNPSLHQYLGKENNEGFVATITGNRQLADVIHTDQDMSFDFLSSGPVPPDPTEIIVGHTVKQFLDKIGKEYDHIILDGPPVMGLADAPQIGSAVDGTLMIVEAGRVRGGQTKTAMRRLKEANTNLLGVVLSKFDGQASGYGDNYGYQYNYGNNSD